MITYAFGERPAGPAPGAMRPRASVSPALCRRRRRAAVNVDRRVPLSPPPALNSKLGRSPRLPEVGF